jgi:hypothetical protein
MAQLDENTGRRLAERLLQELPANGQVKVALYTEAPPSVWPATEAVTTFTVDDPAKVVMASFWTAPVGGRMLSRGEAERLLGKDEVARLMGDG